MILDLHHEAIEFDLIERGIDLLDLYKGRMSWRRLGVLLRNLPADSAYQTSVRDAMTPDQMQEAVDGADPNRHGRWSLANMLAARNGDYLAALVWQNAGGKGEPPEPYRRPGVVDTTEPITDEALEYLLKVRELRGGDPNA